MANSTLRCAACGSAVPHGAVYCANCGAKITASNPPAPNLTASYYTPPPVERQAVSTGPYKAIIAVLLIIIVILGVGYFEASAGKFPFSATYRYQLTNPPNPQSIQPPNTSTPPPGPTIWNACGAGPCTMSPAGWREGTVPDTYDYFVSYTSNVSITVYFFTLGQFVQYAVCNGNVNCVSGSYAYFPAASSQQNAVFKLAEGCADYVAVYTASQNGVLTPDIKVAQNPAPTPTGYCAQT